MGRKTRKTFLDTDGIRGVDEFGNDFFISIRQLLAERSATRHENEETMIAIHRRTDTLSSGLVVAASSETPLCHCLKSVSVIIGVSVSAHVGAASGESMSIDVYKHREGVTDVKLLSVPIVLDSTVAGKKIVLGTLDKGNVSLKKEDYLYVKYTYTAGGTPAPMSGLCATVLCKL